MKTIQTVKESSNIHDLTNFVYSTTYDYLKDKEE